MTAQSMPSDVSNQVPEAKSLLFVKLPDRVLLIDPDSKRVSEIVMDADSDSTTGSNQNPRIPATLLISNLTGSPNSRSPRDRKRRVPDGSGGLMNRYRISWLPAVFAATALLLSAEHAAAQEVGLAPLDVKEVARGYRAEALKLKPVVNDKNETIGKISDYIFSKEGTTFMPSLPSTILPDPAATWLQSPSANSNWTIPPATLSCRGQVQTSCKSCPSSSTTVNNHLRALSSGVSDALFAVTDQPVDDAKRKDCSREREDLQRLGFPEIENDDLATDGKQRDDDNRTDLDHVFAALRDHQERFLEFERDDHGKDHAEYGLENRVVRWIEASGQDEAEQIFKLRFQTATTTMMAINAVRIMMTMCSKPLIEREHLQLVPGLRQLLPDRHLSLPHTR